MHPWRVTDETGGSGATRVTYSNITAFRFPDRDQVYFTCNVDICDGGCDRPCAVDVDTAVKPPLTTVRPATTLVIGVQTPTLRPVVVTYPPATTPAIPFTIPEVELATQTPPAGPAGIPGKPLVTKYT